MAVKKSFALIGLPQVPKYGEILNFEVGPGTLF